MNNNELIHLLKRAAAKQLPYVIDEELIHKTLYWLAAERIEELEKIIKTHNVNTFFELDTE